MRRHRCIAVTLAMFVTAPAGAVDTAGVARAAAQRTCTPKGWHVVYAAERARVLKRDGKDRFRSCDIQTKRVWDLGAGKIEKFSQSGPWLLFHRPLSTSDEIYAHDVQSGIRRKIYTQSQYLTLWGAAVTRGGTVVYEASNARSPSHGIYADTVGGQVIRLDADHPVAFEPDAVKSSLAVAERSGALAPIAYWRAADGTAASADVP
ncbi:MAG: hypothetical protein QOG56_59 [Solirubrobacteraceae bacterium]|nr:hypothetical protein [Solirubrobacteraceae bacterium]